MTMAIRGLLTISVCILALGLAACSSDDTPTTGTGGTTDPGSGGGSGGPTDPTDPMEPAEPTSPGLQAAVSQRDEARRAVERAAEQLRTAQTPAERASATLRRDAAGADLAALTARVNLERARLEVDAAAAEARAASTDAERSAARTRLQAAEARLAPIVQEATRALEAARAALAASGADAADAAARSAAQEVQTRATGILARVQAYQVSARAQIATARLLVAETPEPEPGSGRGATGTAAVATVVRHARAASDGTTLAQSARLAIATAAVPYSTGKRVIASDRSGSDELPLRDLTLRIGTTTAGDVKIQGRDGSATTYTETDGVPVSSINLGSDRFVYKFGGEGVTFHDTQRRFDIGDSKDKWKDLGADRQTGTTDDDHCWQSDLARCSAWNSDDLEITWQAGLSGSYNSPNGEPVYYRSSRVPFPEGQAPSQPNLLPTFQNRRNNWDLGLYELWVTNHGGYDRKLEPADARGQRFRTDDEDRYLKFAAYGLFVHTDTLTDYLLPSRVQAFHFGYDAFEDKADKRTTDISAPIDVRFEGRTMGFMYEHFGNPNPYRVDIRGEVVLNARIGGSGANTISGQVTSLEKLSAHGRWVRFERAANIRTGNVGDRLVFASDSFGASGQDFAASGAAIGADGSYSGGVYLQQWDSGTSAWVEKTGHFKSSSGTSLSEFGGSLYGPTGNDLGDLETAGYWYLEGDVQQQRWGGMVGSFGAVGTTQTN